MDPPLQTCFLIFGSTSPGHWNLFAWLEVRLSLQHCHQCLLWSPSNKWPVSVRMVTLKIQCWSLPDQRQTPISSSSLNSQLSMKDQVVAYRQVLWTWCNLTEWINPQYATFDIYVFCILYFVRFIELGASKPSGSIVVCNSLDWCILQLLLHHHPPIWTIRKVAHWAHWCNRGASAMYFHRNAMQCNSHWYSHRYATHIFNRESTVRLVHV